MCRSYTYKGLIIYENDKGSRFDSPYFSIVNPKRFDEKGKMLHCHAVSESSARKIADCFSKLLYTGTAAKYSLNIRNKCLRLLGQRVIMR